MKSTIAKKTEGYGYKYTELADINKYCEENDIRYYQEVETSDINQKDYIMTYVIKDGETTKHRGCQIVEAKLQGINNPVQAYGSSLTYCRRYSLLMALGLATEDDDAASLTEEDLEKMTLEDAQEYTLDFGKYKGKKISELSNHYIQWLLENCQDKLKLMKAIELVTGEVIKTDDEWDEQLDLTKQLMDLIVNKGLDVDKICEYYGVNEIKDLNEKQIKEIIEKRG